MNDKQTIIQSCINPNLTGFIYQWRNFEQKRDLFTWKKVIIMMISSLMLALHFGVRTRSADNIPARVLYRA